MLPDERPRSDLLLRSVASLLLAALLIVSWDGRLDAEAQEQTRSALERALISFAIARTLNGVISVAQGTELAFQPAGVGVVLTAGEILDPLNDLVERFSWLVLLAASSLGIQIVLSEMVATAWLNAALTVFVLTSLTLLWFPNAIRPAARTAMLRFTLALLFLRFSLVIVTLATSAIHNGFLDEREQESMDYLSRTNTELQAQQTEPLAAPDNERSLLDRFQGFIDERRQALDIERRLDALRATVEDAVRHVVNLIVVYLLETVLLPLALLAVWLATLKFCWRRLA